MTDIEFIPSPAPTVAQGLRRDLALVFLGDSFVTGVGDPKGQGWVTRVVGRTQDTELDLTAYNLGVRGATSTDTVERWRTEVPARWAGRSERRLVLSVGTEDIRGGVSLARHRLNLANILDDASSSGIGTFVVSPPPSDDEALDDKLAVLVDAQADVCARRSVPFVNCHEPLRGHEQWVGDVAVGRIPGHPGQAGYGLIAWLVLHHGWNEWLGIG